MRVLWALLAVGCLTACPAREPELFQLNLVSPQEARKLEGAVFVDVRGGQDEAFQVSHIPGASLLAYLVAGKMQRDPQLPRDKELVLYCACGDDVAPTLVGEELFRKYGYRRIKVLKGGLTAWKAAKLPVESSPSTP